MTRADALRKLLALGGLYRDEIFTQMGGDYLTVASAIEELRVAGDLEPVREDWLRQKYRLTTAACMKAFDAPISA